MPAINTIRTLYGVTKYKNKNYYNGELDGQGKMSNHMEYIAKIYKILLHVERFQD